MWLFLAFCSAALLGFYDVFKKKSLANNAVLPVLGLNTLFSSLIFLPFILVSYFHPAALQDTLFYVPSAGWEVHKFIILKSFIVLSSWTFGYFGMKHLPLTIVGPINATRPVMTLVGALLIFGERLNVCRLDWCADGHHFVLHAEPFRKERRNRFQARQMDLVCGAGGCVRCCQWFVR